VLGSVVEVVVAAVEAPVTSVMVMGLVVAEERRVVLVVVLGVLAAVVGGVQQEMVEQVVELPLGTEAAAAAEIITRVLSVHRVAPVATVDTTLLVQTLM
jgi:hypothetical protein